MVYRSSCQRIAHTGRFYEDGFIALQTSWRHVFEELRVDVQGNRDLVKFLVLVTPGLRRHMEFNCALVII